MRIVFVLALLIFPLGGPTLAEDATAPAPAAAEPALPAISVTEVRQATLSDLVYASGMIGPVEQVFVQPQIEGLAIEEVLAEVGDKVTAGQVIARLSESTLNLQKSQLLASRASAAAGVAQAQASLIDAQSSADEAVRVRDRTVTLKDQGATTQAAADQATAAAASALARLTSAQQGLASARAQADVVEAQIEDVELRLRRTQIIATVDGQISERSAMVGAIASAAGAPMFVIVRDGLLELKADVAEQDVLKLAIGQTVTISPVGASAPVIGRVRLVEPRVDAATRLGRVRIELDDSSSVRDGLFAEARILVTQHEAVAAPVTAVATSGDGPSVLKVDADGLVSRIAVQTGIRDGDRIEITSGLVEGDRIVARAGAFVRDGDRINPVLAATDAVTSN